MQQVSMNGIYKFLNDNKDKIEYVKATRFHAYAFNEVEGYQWSINVKVITKDDYKNKLLQVVTNSTYLEDFQYDNETETDYSDSEFHENFEDWLNTAIM